LRPLLDAVLKRLIEMLELALGVAPRRDLALARLI